MLAILNDLQPWYHSIGALLFFMVVRYIYKNFLLYMLRTINEKMSFAYCQDLLSSFESPINVILYVSGLYAFVNLCPIPELSGLTFIDRILRSTVILSFFWGIYNLSDSTHAVMLGFLDKLGIKSEAAISNIFATVLRIIIVVIAFVAIAKEWKYDISAFIASLSIGSVAVAFAAKDALANVFGSLIIILEKPFKIGDWITANGIEGTVENISFRSTCIRTFPQELVYVPNSLLSNTPITNFTKREKRRIDFTLGLTYGTTRTQMEDTINKVRSYLENRGDLYEDDIRVHFVAYNSSSLDIRVTCYARTGDHKEYLDILQQINLDMLRILEEAGVSCAFPSTSVYFETPLRREEAAPRPVSQAAVPEEVTEK